MKKNTFCLCVHMYMYVCVREMGGRWAAVSTEQTHSKIKRALLDRQLCGLLLSSREVKKCFFSIGNDVLLRRPSQLKADVRNSLGENELFFLSSVKAASGAQFPFLSPFGPWPKKWENCSACLRVKEKKSKFEIKRKKHLCEVRA